MRFSLILFTTLVIYGCGSQLDVPKAIISEYSKQTPLDLDQFIPGKPYFGSYTIPSDNPMTVEGVELGRMLFYEKMLSGDNTMSCGSCHKQAFAFSDGLAVSKGIDGIAGHRSSMAIVNPLWDKNFFWDGRVVSLEEQALGPIENPIELHQRLPDAVAKLEASNLYPIRFEAAFGDPTITPDRIAKAIAQFERRLISINSKYDKWDRGEIQLTTEELRGFVLMRHPEPGLRGGNCSDCHKFNTMTDPEGDLRNNGVDMLVDDIGLEGVTLDANDKGKMKIPTLRNIALSPPYMHDGRFNTLEEVLDHYNEHTIRNHENVDDLIRSGYNNSIDSTLSLTEQEKSDIIAFLKTLTDEEFLTNPDFSDPF